MATNRIEDMLNAQQSFFAQMQQQMQQLSRETDSGVVVPDKKVQLKQYQQRLEAISKEKAVALKRYDEKIKILNDEIKRLNTEIEVSEDDSDKKRVKRVRKNK